MIIIISFNKCYGSFVTQRKYFFINRSYRIDSVDIPDYITDLKNGGRNPLTKEGVLEAINSCLQVVLRP